MESFENVSTWLKEKQRYRKHDSYAPMTLAGNKIDLLRFQKRAVLPEVAKAFAATNGMACALCAILLTARY